MAVHHHSGRRLAGIRVRICGAALERGRPFAAAEIGSPGSRRICNIEPWHHRSARIPAGVHRTRIRPSSDSGAARRVAVFQTGEIFTGDALALGSPSRRATSAVRMPRDPCGRSAGVRFPALCGRARRAARQIGHHSAGDVVGDRDARHGWLWRCRAGHAARKGDFGFRHHWWTNHDRAANCDYFHCF